MSEASIVHASGPLLRARVKPGSRFSLYDSVRVGEQHLLGEVIRLDRDQITVQVYEETTGLAPGQLIKGEGQPLSIPLGPAMLGGIFDGLLRPLTGLQQHWLPRGFSAERPQHIRFHPEVNVGDSLNEGQTYGSAKSDRGMQHSLSLAPGVSGRVLSISPPDVYSEHHTLMTLEDDQGQQQEVCALQPWPVRIPRPVAQRLVSNQPLVTGQRILDSLFPIALGGKGAVPGGFGTGKTVLLETLAKWCHADVIVYVGCGERGNELTGMLEEFPKLSDPRRNRPLMERTVIIANTSNMPVAAREASVYTAVTVAEYFRDQGMNVALMADSTSRWAEALREISGRLGELPGEGGYPAYLSSRLAEFYERAGLARTLGGDKGSVTIIGTVSPPSGDFSEPVTAHTKRYVRSFWALDSSLAQARMYPAVNPLQSYSEDVERMTSWWAAQGNADWPLLRQRALFMLQEQARLERMARIIGKDAMPYEQQLRLLCADLLSECFLRQSAFSEIDRYASPQRQTAILRMLSRFTELAVNALSSGATPEDIAALPIFRRLQRMSEDIAEDQLGKFDQLQSDVEAAFRSLTTGQSTEAPA